MFHKMLAITITLTLLIGKQVFAEGTIGASFSQIIDDRSLGITGDYTTPIGKRITFEADGRILSGNIHNITLNTDFTFDIATVDLKLLIENKVKGYTLDTLGREQSLGLAFTLPVESLNFDVGIGGKNASPFGVPNAYDTLIGEGFSETELTGKGLESLSAALKGLPFKNGNSVNAFLATGFEAGIFDVDLKGVIELLGDGDKQHQAILNFKTTGKVYDVNVTTALELSLMAYQEALHYETAVVTTAGFEF
jgi:hypothetical protein